MQRSIRFLVGMLICGLSLTAFAAPPDTLTLSDLAKRPELLPPTVKLQRDYQFTNGPASHQGDTVQVLKFDGNKVIVASAGHVRFAVPPQEVGLLEAANQAWSALTPAQRAVDAQSLANDPSLWPVQITVMGKITCNLGVLNAGTQVQLLDVREADLDVCWPNSNKQLTMDAPQTDLIQRARALALVDRSKRPSRIVAALEGLMVDANGKAYRESLDDKKIFALYYGASWCPPCRAFSPGFVKSLNRIMPKHPELAVIMLSNDKDPGKMFEYMNEEHMPFAAVPLASVNASALLNNYAAKMIPHLVIVDRFGKTLATSDDAQGNRSDLNDTVVQMEKILDAPQ